MSHKYTARRLACWNYARFAKQSGMPLSVEYRVFIYAGRVITIDGYWHQNARGSFTKKESVWIQSIVERVKSSFATVDLARKEDGSLIIMEFGDGQVSGLQQLRAEEFYKSFESHEMHPLFSIKDP